MSKALIFDLNEIEKLKLNIAELTRQKSMQRKEYKEVKLMQTRLQREKSEKEETVSSLEQKCIELQMLKFGRLVDVEAMQETHINEAAEELKV